MKKRVVAYTRVSTDKEEQKTSIKYQKISYEEYCRKNGYELVKIYTDEGLSATSPNRKEFLELLYDAGLDLISGSRGKNLYFEQSKTRKPKFDFIITKDVSRFARNQNSIDIAKKLVENGVHIIFEDSTLSTLKENWQFEFGMYLNFAEMESRDKSRKVSAGYRQRALQGLYHMPIVLYGYTYDKETNSYVIDENEAKYVRKMFDLYTNQNMGLKLITNYLNDLGIRTKKGKVWTSETVKRLLKNEKYKGDVILRRRTKTDITSSGKVIQRNEDEWTILKNAITPIVDEETWNKAQELLKSRVTKAKDGSIKGLRKYPNKFYGKLVCSKCNATFTRVSGTKVRHGKKVVEYTYYCRNRRRKNLCDMRGISQKVLEREINKLTGTGLHDSLIKDITEERKAYKIIIERLEYQLTNCESKRKEINKEIEIIDKNITKITTNFLNAESPVQNIIDAMTDQINRLEENKKQLLGQLLEYDTLKIEKKIEQVKQRLYEIEKAMNKKMYTFDEIMDLISDIYVHEGRKFIVNLKVPSLVGYALQPNKFDTLEEYNLIRSFEFVY